MPPSRWSLGGREKGTTEVVERCREAHAGKELGPLLKS